MQRARARDAAYELVHSNMNIFAMSESSYCVSVRWFSSTVSFFATLNAKIFENTSTCTAFANDATYTPYSGPQLRTNLAFDVSRKTRSHSTTITHATTTPSSERMPLLAQQRRCFFSADGKYFMSEPSMYERMICPSYSGRCTSLSSNSDMPQRIAMRNSLRFHTSSITFAQIGVKSAYATEAHDCQPPVARQRHTITPMMMRPTTASTASHCVR